MSRPRFVVKGAKELIRQLKSLGSERTAQRVLRKATNAATTPLLKAVRENTPIDSGALRRSMAKKLIGKGWRFDGLVGSDTTKTMPDGERAARHLHLVEFGFEHEGGEVVPGQHPLQKGFDESHAQCAAVYEAKIATEIEREAMKGAANG